MKGLLSSIVLVASLLAAACTPAAPPSPTAAPSKPTAAPAQPTAAVKPAAAATTVPAAKPTEAAKPAAPATTAPAAKPTEAARPAGATTPEWDALVAAARQEGRVQVIGPTGDQRRDSLVQQFEQKYGITVEYLAEAGAGVPPRLDAERKAGQYRWDVMIGGTLEVLLGPLNVLAPMEPSLVLPQVKDASKWRGGMEFVDPGRTILVMMPIQRGTLFVNSAQVKPGDITSYKDLLDPRYRGKIVADDPRRQGPGLATFTFFHQHPDLGPSFLRSLHQQEMTLMTDYGQEVDAVGQGRVPVVIGTSDSLAEQRMRQGIPIDIVDPRSLKEGTDASVASAMVGIFDRPANPNAARVYLNWLLSQEGQTAYARGSGYVSARTDVPTDHALPWRVPIPGSIKTYGLEIARVQQEQVLPLMRELFGG
jgi:iron(III) transport system substrate-binding protein